MGLVILFVFVLYFINNIKISETKFTNSAIGFLGTIWFIPGLTTEMFIPLLLKGGKLLKMVDQGWIEYYGGQGINSKIIKISSYLDLVNYSNIKFYIFVRFLVFMLVLILMV